MTDRTAAAPMHATLHMDGWAGHRDYPVEILRETPTRFQIRLLSGEFRQGHRTRRAGDVWLAPKHAVTKDALP